MKAVRPDVALAVVGKTLVDYSSLLANGTLDLAVGDVVRISGTQPQQGERVLASKVTKY